MPSYRPASLAATVLLELTGLMHPAAAAPITNFSYTGGLQTFTVPTDGSYYIVAAGARGGSTEIAAGGLGAAAIGTFALHTGNLLDILVGGAGANGGSTVGGGGAGAASSSFRAPPWWSEAGAAALAAAAPVLVAPAA